MKLEYTSETSEARSVELATRFWKTQLALFFRPFLALLCICTAGSAVALAIGNARFFAECGIGVLFALIATVLESLVIDVSKRRAAVRDYRATENHKWTYGIEDGRLLISGGETKITARLRDVARWYRLDDDALYFGRHWDVLFTLPDWSGHGAGKAELETALKEAGLRPLLTSGVKTAFRWLNVAVVVFSVLVACWLVCASVHSLRREVACCELRGEIAKAVGGDAWRKEDGKCRYVAQGRAFTSLQGWIAGLFKFDFTNKTYFYMPDGKYNKVGIGAVDGDVAYDTWLPTQWANEYSLPAWERKKAVNSKLILPREEWLVKIKDKDYQEKILDVEGR